MKTFRLSGIVFSASVAAVWLTVWSFGPPEAQAQKMAKAEEPEEVGLVSIGKTYFPLPPEYSDAGSVERGDFEGDFTNTEDLKVGGYELRTDGAPEGTQYAASKEDQVFNFSLEHLADGNQPYLFSLWLKSDGAVTGSYQSESEASYFGKHTPLPFPDTRGEWKRVGFYFRSSPQATGGRIAFRLPGKGGARLAVDDLRLRPATEAEFSAAYAGWRAQYPKRDLSTRPGDGKHLSLFVSKLQHPKEPVEPLLVMGIGSSYTNMLGNGETLRQHLLETFPGTPPIEYVKHVGSSVNYDFTRGWMRQMVLGRQPDLVILYSGGDAANLEKLLSDFRAHSTADVIVASLHLREVDKEITEETIHAPEWDEIRAVAQKYGCEFVESRQEWAAYVTEHGEGIKWLLKDAVHQSDHGALVINENIARHLVPNAKPAYRPQERERRLMALKPESIRDGEDVVVEGGFDKKEGDIVLEDAGAKITVSFQGNRLDLVGVWAANGGVADVLIDGKPAGRYPAFLTTLIVPGAKNHRPERGMTADRSPHMVLLGKNLIPQDWTIRMISDTGDYELVGSVTGPDGVGNNGADFTSGSGQITIPTELWRRRQEKDGTYSNRTGDTFTFSVYRATLGEVSFAGGDGGAVFSVTLADQLENGPHKVTLVNQDDGPVRVRAFDVFEPPF